MVRALAFRVEGPGFKSRPRHIRDLFLEPIQSVGAEWTINCVCVPVWVADSQALVAAITGEVNILLSLDLSSLGDGSQLPGRAAITNYGQGNTISTKHTSHTLTSVPCVGQDYATYAGQHRE
jgi:hypothetical protein